MVPNNIRCPLKFSLKNVTAIFFLLLILAANALMLAKIAFSGFNLFDWGSFLDASWRIFRGQKPFEDFYYSTGPLHLYMNAFFFKIFGFGKTALLAHIVSVSSILILVTFFVTRPKMPLAISLLLTFLAASSFYWTHPHPWYIYNAQFWGILGYFALVWQLPFRGAKQAFWTGFLCGIMGILSLMTKSDVGGANGLVFFAVLVLSEQKIKSVLGYISGVLLALLAMCLLMSPMHYYENALQTYGANRSSQIFRLLLIPVWFKNLYWLPLLALPFAIQPLRKPYRVLFWLFLGIFLSAIFSLNVGSLRWRTHIPLMSTYLSVAFVILFHMRPLCVARKEKIRLWIVIAIMLLVTGLQIQRTVNHALILAKGQWPKNDLYLQGNYTLRAAPFRGWHFDEISGPTLDGIVDFVHQNIPGEETLLILTDFYIVNALTGRESYRGIPFIWGAGDQSAPGGYLKKVHERITTKPPEWILIHKEPAPYRINQMTDYLKITDFILQNYRLVKNWGAIGMFRRTT